MALTMPFPARTGGTEQNAYILVDMTLDNKAKAGRVELAVWKDAAARAAGCAKVNNVCVPVGATQTVDEAGCATQLAWNDFAWKTGSEVYSKTKTLVVRTLGSVADLSEAEDC